MTLFIKKAREVSSKYHKIGRSIIKNRQASYETGEISNENAPIIVTYTDIDRHIYG